MTIVQGRSDERPTRRVGIWTGLGITLWGLLNLGFGVVTAFPVGFGATLVAYLANDPGSAHHPYTKVFGRVSPFPIDSDEVEIVGAGILFGLIIVIALFGAVNVGLRALLRRWPGWAYWPATLLLLALPSLWFWR
jgi:hypothetical protein